MKATILAIDSGATRANPPGVREVICNGTGNPTGRSHLPASLEYLSSFPRSGMAKDARADRKAHPIRRRFCHFMSELSTVQKSRKALQSIMTRLGLKLHPERTKLVELCRGKERFNFLGFHFHKCISWQYPGKHYCLSWPSPNAMKRIRQKVKAITAEWRQLSFSIESVVERLNPMIRGGSTTFEWEIAVASLWCLINMSTIGSPYSGEGNIGLAGEYGRRESTNAWVFSGQWDMSYGRKPCKANGRAVVGKPYEGKPHVRFDEGAVETG